MSKHKILLLVLSLFWLVSDVQPFNLWGSSETQDSDPKFLTNQTHHVKEENTRIDLQCYIDKYPSDLVITWKNTHGALLYRNPGFDFRLTETQ